MISRLLLILLTIGVSPLLAQSFISFDGLKIAYTDEGSGPTVVLIHGFINTSASWQGTAVYKQLLGQGYRIIAPDLRGNGKSDKPQVEKAYTNNAEVKDLKALLDHLDIENVTAIGYSRGSIVLAKWLTMDSRISKAVIGGVGLDFSNPLWERRILFEEAFLGLNEGTQDTQGAIQYAKSQGADIRILGWSQRYQPVTSQEKLSKITIPVLVVAGDQDKDNGAPQELAELLPHATLSIVTGDHNTTYRKALFAKEVLAFVKK